MKRIHTIIAGALLLIGAGIYGYVTKDIATAVSVGGLATFLLGLSKQHPEDARMVKQLKSGVPTPTSDKGSGVSTLKLVVLFFGLTIPQLAQAADMPTPLLGGCFGTSKQLCAGLVIPEGISGLKLTNPGSGALVAGAFPAGGAGYALHYWWSEWHTVSLAIAIAVSSGTDDTPTSANIAGLLVFVL